MIESRVAKTGVLALVLLAVVAASAEQARDDQASEREIRSTLAAWVRATNARDDASANTIWAPKMVGWFPAAPEFSEGAAYALVGIAETKGGAYSTYELVIEDVSVSGTLAAVHDIWTETLHFNGSVVTVRRIIRGSELWRVQTDGKWRIARFVSAPEKWTRVQ